MVQLDVKREVKVYWQPSLPEYFSECLTTGFTYVQNNGQLKWVSLLRNEASATIHPSSSTIFSSASYLSLSFGGETKLLKLEIYFIYSAPTPLPALIIIISDFTAISDVFLSANSKFTFSDNKHDICCRGSNIYGVVMFNSFEQGALKTEGCGETCDIRTFALLPRHYPTFSRDEY